MLSGKIPLERPRLMWDENGRKDFKKLVSVEGIVLIRLRVVIIGKPW